MWCVYNENGIPTQYTDTEEEAAFFAGLIDGYYKWEA